MEIAQITLQIIVTLLVVLAVIQKQKWKMMLFYIIGNIMCVFMYFAFARIDTAVICIVATIRTTIIMIYSLKNKKLNIAWLIIFELAFIISIIFTWQDYLSLLALFAMLAVGYGTWQDNKTVLRVSLIINMTLYTIYEFVIGAYIAMATEIVQLISTFFSLIYYSVYKNDVSIIQFIFKRKNKQPEQNIQTEQNNNYIEENLNNEQNNIGRIIKE